MRTAIFGPAYQSRSTNVADNRLVNLYTETVELKDGKIVAGALYGTPGMRLLTTVGGGPIRAMKAQGNAMYVISGPELYVVGMDFSTGLAGADIGPGAASIIANLNQIAVFGGNTGHTYAAGTYASIVLPFAPLASISAAQQDGFGVINQPGSSLWWQSDLEDFTTWQALNFADASGDPDFVVTMAQINREIWLFKQDETEIWYNAGTAGFIFARLDGAYIEVGIAAQASLARAGDSFVFLGNSTQGSGVFYQTKGHSAQRVSNHAIEAAIQKYETIQDCIAYTYQQDGHLFYVANFPTGNSTWVLDLTDTALSGVPQWHERAAFDERTGLFARHWGNAHCNFAGKCVIGDYRNGNLYEFDLSLLTDNGEKIKRLRSWPALPQLTNKTVRFSQLQIMMQSGLDIPQADNPQMMLRYSDDGGHNWSREWFEAVGKAGKTAQRVMFNRMGSTKRNGGLNRIIEVSGTDEFPWAIVGAELDAS